MEEDKKLFKNLNLPNKKEKEVLDVDKIAYNKSSRRSVVNKNTTILNENFIEHLIENNVKVTLVKDVEEDYTKVTDIKTLLLLDKRKPSNIVGFNPPLYKEFIDNKNNTINTYVNIGDKVKLKEKFKLDDLNLEKEVSDIYLKSLNNMTVVVAVLTDNSYHLSNRLIKCK